VRRWGAALLAAWTVAGGAATAGGGEPPHPPDAPEAVSPAVSEQAGEHATDAREAPGQAPHEEAAEAAPEAAPEATFYATATVRERPVETATAAVTVLAGAAAEEAAVLSVAEMLPWVPGLTLTTAGTRGGLTAVQLRGGDPNFTRVLVDGVPVNDGTYQVGEVFDVEALPADGVERVEVVRGPLSAHYGSTGLAGALQVVTRLGDGPPTATASLTAGDASLRRAALTAAGGGGAARWSLTGVGEEEAERIAEERWVMAHLQGRASLALGERTDLELAGRFADWQADDYPDASGGPLLGSGELRHADNREDGLGTKLLHRTGSGSLLRLDLAYYRHDLDRDSPAVAALVPPSVESTRFTRVRVGGAVSLAPRPAWSLSLGADAEREEGDNRSLLLLPPFLGGATPGDYALERTTPGAYGELAGRRGDLSVELGLRLDVPQEAGERWSPRLGLAWRLGTATRLRASAGRAFKLPSFFALASPPALGGNPDLEPEVMLGGDLGVEHDLAARGLRAAVTGFVHRYEDLVDFDFDRFTHVNRAAVDAHGVELALDWAPPSSQPGRRWAAAAATTWQAVEDRATGDPLRHRPRWSGSARLTWRAAPRVDLHAGLRFASSSADEQIPVPGRGRVAGYELLGAAATWRPAPSWRLTARADNLADEGYEVQIGFPGPGRSFRVGVARRFGDAAAAAETVP
jgi:outer membrane cobalamin receptor